MNTKEDNMSKNTTSRTPEVHIICGTCGRSDRSCKNWHRCPEHKVRVNTQSNHATTGCSCEKKRY